MLSCLLDEVSWNLEPWNRNNRAGETAQRASLRTRVSFIPRAHVQAECERHFCLWQLIESILSLYPQGNSVRQVTGLSGLWFAVVIFMWMNVYSLPGYREEGGFVLPCSCLATDPKPTGSTDHTWKPLKLSAQINVPPCEWLISGISLREQKAG